MAEEKIGTVTHYFAEPEVGALSLDDQLRVGDVVAFRGHTTDFQQTVESMEIDHESVETAGPNDEVALKVKDRVREGDEVYVVERTGF
ncbi:MAG: translation elongation factor-like protein [Gemmatimonadota bacterium]|nr:translation elongation factor-like protein [Gemmatimonadota bacterium]